MCACGKCFGREQLRFAAKLAHVWRCKVREGWRSKSKQKSSSKNSFCKFKNRLGKMLSVIFISNIIFQALGDGLERRRQTCGKLGEANQKRKHDRMKTSFYKFKNRFGNMLACDHDMYFHNLVSSSGERA